MKNTYHRIKVICFLTHQLLFHTIHTFVKFVYSEKATKFCEISNLLLSIVHTDKSKVEISQNFVAFSEYMNFIKALNWLIVWKKRLRYRRVASSNTSRFEAHAGLLRLSVKGIFNAYVRWPFGRNFIFELVTRVRTRDYTVFS